MKHTISTTIRLVVTAIILTLSITAPVHSGDTSTQCESFVIDPEEGPGSQVFTFTGEGCPGPGSSGLYDLTIENNLNNYYQSVIAEPDINIEGFNFIFVNNDLVKGDYEVKVFVKSQLNPVAEGIFTITEYDSSITCNTTVTLNRLSECPVECKGRLIQCPPNELYLCDPAQPPDREPDIDCGTNQGSNDTEICNRLGGADDTLRQQCWDCYYGRGEYAATGPGMWTALGCISRTNITLQVRNFITVGISLAGGLALLLILYGSFLISTSAGDPQKVGEGKEIITAAIAGLVFIILSVVMLKFIGFEILKIPGF